MSKRLKEWTKFERQVELHLVQYAEKQYGNPSGNEQLDFFTVDDCWREMERYFNRRRSNARGPIEQLRDVIKLSHYAGVLYYKLLDELGMEEIYGPAEGDESTS